MKERTETLTYKCNAPDEVFVERYEDVPEEHKNIIESQGSLPCDGGGIPGEWCLRGCAYFGGRT